MNQVWLINGIPGSGKTTTARALAKRFAKSAHIEGDKLQDLIIAGNVPPGGALKEEESAQIHLNVKHQCLLARSLAEAGFVPVIDYVIVNNARVLEYKTQLEGFTLCFVTLNPGPSVALKRDELRPEKTVAAQWIHLGEEMNRELKSSGLWVDNSHISLAETVNYILEHQGEASI